MAPDTCAHGGCTCTVDSGQQYCSDYCSSHGGGSGHEHSCECGHPGCGGGWPAVAIARQDSPHEPTAARPHFLLGARGSGAFRRVGSKLRCGAPVTHASRPATPPEPWPSPSWTQSDANAPARDVTTWLRSAPTPRNGSKHPAWTSPTTSGSGRPRSRRWAPPAR